MAGDEYVELPVELIQHILSLLDPKQAVHTSALSKLWYYAWSTRPVLCLDENIFPRTKTLAEFLNFARTSIDRYEKLNVKLNTFKLSMFRNLDAHDEFTRLVDELILSALTLGFNDFDLRFYKYTCGYTLPDQVFCSTYLKKLYIRWCNINLPPSKALCSQLVTLELFLVRVSDDMMRDILLGCPLLEDLRVDCCSGLKEINLSVVHCNLRTFYADSTRRNILVEWAENNAPGLQNQFQNLISLELCEVEVDDLFFEFFPHRFPCLERLELKRCLGPVMIDIDITSNSLRYLTLKWINRLRFIKVQVPNIQNFTLAIEQMQRIC